MKQHIEAFIKQGKLQRFIEKERTKENPPRDLKPNRRAEEELRAPLREITVIVGGSMIAGSSKKVRKTYLKDGAKCLDHQTFAQADKGRKPNHQLY